MKIGTDGKRVSWRGRSGMRSGMQFGLWIFAGLLSVLLPIAGYAQEASLADQATAGSITDPPISDSQATYGQMRTLLRTLESVELAERDQAEAQIIELGPAVMPFLPSITPQTSGEMKVRLQRIRQAIERAMSKGFFEPSTVTASGSMQLSEILKRIESQTGNVVRLQVDDQGDDEPTLELNWMDVPFWTAIDEVLKQTKLRVALNSNAKNELVLVTRGTDNPVGAAITGPFRVELAAVESRQNFDSRVEGQSRVHLLIVWEPRLQPLFMQMPMSNFRASVEGGSEIVAVNPRATPEVRLTAGGSAARVEVQMQRPPRIATKLDSFEGQFVVSVPGDRHKYTFEKFGNGARQSQKYGDLSVTLEGSRKNGPVYEIRFFVEFGDAAGALESYRSWIMSNEAYLLDAGGVRLDSVGFQTYANANNGAGVSYLFQIKDNPDSYKLIYESPSAVTRQTVDFSLKDIPLP